MDEIHENPDVITDVRRPSLGRRRMWVLLVVIVTLLAAGAPVILLRSGNDGRRVATAATVEESSITQSSNPATTDPPTVSEPASPSSVTSTTELVVSPTTLLPPRRGNTPSLVEPPTTENEPTTLDYIKGEYTPGSGCRSMTVWIGLSDPQGIESVVLDWSSPAGGGLTRLVGPGGRAEKGEWIGAFDLRDPPRLNFWFWFDVVDGAGVTDPVRRPGTHFLIPECREAPPATDPAPESSASTTTASTPVSTNPSTTVLPTTTIVAEALVDGP